MTVTVYSKPACPQCTATYRALDKKGIPYETLDISKDEGALERLKGLGFQQAPVVEFGEQSWSGFQPDRIDDIAHLFAQPELVS